MDTQFTNNPSFYTVRMLLLKGTTIRLAQTQKINSFGIRGVAYIEGALAHCIQALHRTLSQACHLPVYCKTFSGRDVVA